ncbi:hypothetical protein ACFE04_026982 [Oxalis oulophora]
MTNNHSFPSSSTNPPPQPPPPPPPQPPISSSTTANSSSLRTRQEVLTQRSARLKQLSTVYKNQYWILMEEVKRKHKEYVWLYGKSPFLEDDQKTNKNNDSERGGHAIKVGDEVEKSEEGYVVCKLPGCRVKAMAFTKFCHAHILADKKQVLYVGCTYAVKSSHCGKPVLRSTVPSYCSLHFPRAEGFMLRALRRHGLAVSASNKITPELHLLVNEFVSLIQDQRKSAKKLANIESMEE